MPSRPAHLPIVSRGLRVHWETTVRSVRDGAAPPPPPLPRNGGLMGYRVHQCLRVGRPKTTRVIRDGEGWGGGGLGGGGYIPIATLLPAESELRNCVEVEVAVLGSAPNKPTVSVDVKQHSTNQPTEWFRGGGGGGGGESRIWMSPSPPPAEDGTTREESESGRMSFAGRQSFCR